MDGQRSRVLSPVVGFRAIFCSIYLTLSNVYSGRRGAGGEKAPKHTEAHTHTHTHPSTMALAGYPSPGSLRASILPWPRRPLSVDAGYPAIARPQRTLMHRICCNQTYLPTFRR